MPPQRFKLGHWGLLVALEKLCFAFIQLFFFLKGSDLMLWHCSYITCRALALLEAPIMSKHSTWRLPYGWGFGGTLLQSWEQDWLQALPPDSLELNLAVLISNSSFPKLSARHISIWAHDIAFSVRESLFKQKYDFCTAPPSSLADKLHNQTVNFISFPSGCHGASFKQCLLFTDCFGLYKYFFFFDLTPFTKYVRFQMSLAPLFRSRLLYKGITVWTCLDKSSFWSCAERLASLLWLDKRLMKR